MTAVKKMVFLTTAEAICVFAIYAGVLPSKTVFVLLGGLILVMAILSLDEAVIFFVLSIPLFTALPLSIDFDNFAAWRIIVLWLFSVWIFRQRKTVSALNLSRIKSLLLQINVFEWCIMSLFSVSSFSLLVAEDIGFGLRKLIFLANFIPLYILVRWLSAQSGPRNKILLSISLAGCIAVFGGILQFIVIQFISLHTFWKHWAQWVIPVFYGSGLGGVLSASNTWFSYYSNAPPTLRLFSFFPDSHSFGLFSLIATLPTLIIFKISAGLARKIMLTLWIILSLSIYLSGTRGLWLAALPIFFGVLLIYLLTNHFLNIKRRLAVTFLISFVVTVSLEALVLNNIAMIVAFGACTKMPLLCSNLLNSAFELPYNLWVIVLGLTSALLITLITYWLTIKKHVMEYSLARIILLPLLAFLLLLPVSSILLSRAHGAGVVTKDETLIFNRAKSILDINETSNKARLDIWQITAKSVLAHPIFGVGLGNYAKVLGEKFEASRRGASAHNLYLDFAAETGLVGGGLLIAFFCTIIFYSYRLLRYAKEERLKITGAIFGIYFLWIMFYNFFDVVLINDKVLLLFSSLLGAFSGIFIEKRSRI